MTKARSDGLYLALLGTAVFLLLGIALESRSIHPNSDYRFVYNSARCLLQRVDPYKSSEFLRIFLADGGDMGSDVLRSQYLEMSQYMYSPTSFILTPLAMLPWGPSLVLWTILIAGSFILAAFLMWQLGAQQAPLLSGILIGLMLSSSELLLVTGNPAGIVVSLCVVSVWCLVQERFAAAAVVCLAISLMLKPHDAGLIWLYFLLAGGVYRRRALQALAVATALSVPAILWVTHIAPGWLPELRANLAILSSRGHLNDPGPASLAGHGIAMIIDLQTVISFFRDDPSFYNSISYLICGSLVLVWAVTTLRSRSTKSNTWFAIASISALSMLPIYHRLCDAKLLLLTIPACAILWAEGGLVCWLAPAVNFCAFLLTGELQWAIFFRLLKHLSLSSTWLSGNVLMALQIFPVPFILFVVGAFYLWVYVRRASDPEKGAKISVALER